MNPPPASPLVPHLVYVIDADAGRLEQMLAALEAQHFLVIGALSPDGVVEQARRDAPKIMIVRDLPDDCSRTEFCAALRDVLPDYRAILISQSEPLGGTDRDRRALDALVDSVIPRRLPADTVMEHVAELLRHYVTHGSLCLDIRRTRIAGQAMTLLELFLRNPAHVFSREEILAALTTSCRPAHVRSVDVYVRRLRLAIRQAGLPDLIETVRARGYRLVLD